MASKQSHHDDGGSPTDPFFGPSTLSDESQRRPWSAQGIRNALRLISTSSDTRRNSKDEREMSAPPATPSRMAGDTPFKLSLQMPCRDINATSAATRRVPLSPKPDSASGYPSPASVLPRHSRGLDFSRAATNLHHSTLADQPSPDSSPRLINRRSYHTPSRRSFVGNTESNLNISEALRATPAPRWTHFSALDRYGLSSSLGSSAVQDADSESTTSDELMDMADDDDMAQITRRSMELVNPFSLRDTSATSDHMDSTLPSTAKLLNYQRNRLQARRDRSLGSCSDASGQNSLQSPIPPSPPMLKSVEHTHGFNETLSSDGPAKKELDSRRQSLSLGTNDLRLTDAEPSGDEGTAHTSLHGNDAISASHFASVEDRKQVVRRAVTRRSNLLPKSKGFARIRAALMEEGAPLDTELRREAEVVKQVRDNDGDQTIDAPHSCVGEGTRSSNERGSTAPADGNEGGSGDTSTSSDESMRRFSQTSLSNHPAKRTGSVTFWNNFDERIKTPPPAPLLRCESSGHSDDNASIDVKSNVSTTPQQRGQPKTLLVESAVATPSSATAAPFDVARKGHKRMRDEDFDSSYFKRRAVSPGLSVQNSPVLPQSPGWWGTPKKDDRVGSNGSAGNPGYGPAKRIGMQGMNDANDGFMNMSIE